MTNILYDLSPAKLALSVEENLFSWIPVFGLLEGARVNDIPGVQRSITNFPMSLFNSIMDAHLESHQVDGTIAFVQDDARKRDVPVLWWIGPSTQPAGLADRLIKSGFSVDEDGPGMVAVLDKLNETRAIPAGLTIQPVLDDASRWEWCKTLLYGFEAPPERVEKVAVYWHDLLGIVDPEITRAYIARLDGKPVATSLLQLGGGVAGIFAVATLPGERGKGIGTQVTLQPLIDARQRGYKVGVIEASEMGFGVYRALGFETVCQICSYIWRPAES